MNKISIVALLLVLAIAGSSYVFINQDSATDDTDQSMTTPDPVPGEQPLQDYSAQEVAKHDRPDSCWTIIDGMVYDITSYIPNHPAGDEILRACGKDGSSLFNQRQTADGQTVGSGFPHSTNASGILSRYQIGSLVQ